MFVPNLATRTDDQDARSRYAEQQGWAWRWNGTDTAHLAEAAAELCNPEARRDVVGRLGALPPAEGAAQVAAHVRRWL
jgi:hypothetical protein